MEEIIVFVHYQAGSYRIHKFENTGNEEYDSGDESAEAFEA